MADFLLIVSFVVFLWAVVGLIQPRWARLPHRLASVGVWAVSVVLLLLGGSMLPEVEEVETQPVHADRPVAEDLPAQSVSPVEGQQSPTASQPGWIQARGDDLEAARARCRREWRDDFEMQNFCIEEQENAYRNRPLGRVAPDLEAARARCRREWRDDFEMQNFCIEEQENAYRNRR